MEDGDIFGIWFLGFHFCQKSSKRLLTKWTATFEIKLCTLSRFNTHYVFEYRLATMI